MPDESTGILGGLRVIEYADFVSGPYTGRQLAEMGAAVIKVEPPGRGDEARRSGPFAYDRPSLDNSLLFNYLNVNKRGITLDLASATGRELLLQLIAQADMFLFGGAARDVDRLGLSYRDIAAVNPRLLALYVTPFGLTGPYREYASNELVTMHLSGMALSTPGGTGPEKPPLKPGGRQALMVAGLYGALATLHALFAREATGLGQEIDLSEWEPITCFQFLELTRVAFAPELATKRGESLTSPIYRAKDGEVTILPMQEYMWRSMAEVMGSPDWISRPEFASYGQRRAHAAELQGLVESWTGDLSKQEIYERMQARRVPAFPNNTVAEIVSSPQLAARDYFQEIPLPGGESALGPGPRYQFGEGLIGIQRPAPRLGEHTEEVLREQCGLDPADLVALFEAGII